MAAHRADLALAHGDRLHTYADLLAEIGRWRARLTESGIGPGDVVALEGEYGLDSVGAFLALIEAGAIVAPLSSDSATQHDAFHEVAATEWRIALGGTTHRSYAVSRTGRHADHELYGQLRDERHPGLILFSSGSAGMPAWKRAPAAARSALTFATSGVGSTGGGNLPSGGSTMRDVCLQGRRARSPQ